MADTFIYEDANEPQVTLEPFVAKQWVYVLDQNNGSYSGGQILLDSSSISNSGKYASFSEAYFSIPLVMRLTATSANAQVAGVRNLQSAFAAGLKNGYYHLLSSLSIEYNNTTVVQLSPYINGYINFKMLTSLSQDSLHKYGSLIGVFPDSVLSARYGAQAAPSPIGHGSINNFNLPQFPATVYSYNDVNSAGYNAGLYTRQVNSTSLTPTAPAPVSAFISASGAGQIGLNYFRLGTGGDIDSKWWFITAIIRLKDIADFFQKLPLVKGAFIRFTLNLNLATHNFDITTNAGAVTDVSITQNILTGGSTPMMLANASQPGNGLYEIGQTLAGIGNGTFSFQLALNVARDTTYGVQHPTLNSVRLWVPIITMNPVNEEQYLSLNKIKTVRYDDVYTFQVDVPCSGTPGALQGQVNALLTNGIPNPKAIIIVPYIAANANNTGTSTSPIGAYGSPFASEPGTTSPSIALTNFNVQVAGINVFVQNELYDWEAFKHELALANAVNGSQMDGLDSGLISYQMFENNYRYMYVDLSRRIPAENAVPKSIQILGTVLSGTIANVQLMCYVVFGKEIAIDLETGAKLA